MSTCVIYVDEAGSPDSHQIPIKNGTTPIFTLAATVFPFDQWRERDRQFLRKKRHFFPDVLKDKVRDEYVEIKGNELVAPRNRGSSRRHAFNREMLNFIRDQGGTCFGVTFLKDPEKPTSKTSLYTKALQILVERISLFIAEHPVFDNGFLILDSRMTGINNQDGKVAKSHMSYIFGHETGRTFTNVLEAPMFADSRITSGLQIVDIFAANLFANHYATHIEGIDGALDYSHMLEYWPQLGGLQFKSRQEVDGYTMFGYRVVDHRPRHDTNEY